MLTSGLPSSPHSCAPGRSRQQRPCAPLAAGGVITLRVHQPWSAEFGLSGCRKPGSRRRCKASSRGMSPFVGLVVPRRYISGSLRAVLRSPLCPGLLRFERQPVKAHASQGLGRPGADTQNNGPSPEFIEQCQVLLGLLPTLVDRSPVDLCSTVYTREPYSFETGELILHRVPTAHQAASSESERIPFENATSALNLGSGSAEESLVREKVRGGQSADPSGKALAYKGPAPSSLALPSNSCVQAAQTCRNCAGCYLATRWQWPGAPAGLRALLGWAPPCGACAAEDRASCWRTVRRWPFWEDGCCQTLQHPLGEER